MPMNFIHVDSSKKDIEDFFGPFDVNQEFVKIIETDRLETIMVDHLKKFPSLSQARKNGFGGEIPEGFRKWKCGKVFFHTFKPFGKLTDFFSGDELTEQEELHKEKYWK